MRFGFVTCVQLGLSCMEEIYRVGGALEVVITLHDHAARQKSGRIYVDEFCHNHRLDFVKVVSINDRETISAIKDRELDWLFIIGWSQIARSEVLWAPSFGAIGIHPTLLPVGRGRAAIPWTILKGMTRGGVTVFQLDEGVDSGPILLQEFFTVAPDETATSLYAKVELAHRAAIQSLWPVLIAGDCVPQPQDEAKATHWARRRPEDGRITSGMTVEEVDRLVRATTHPFPGAFVQRGEEIVRVWKGCPAPPDTEPPDDTLRITLADGAFDALVTETESIHD